MSCTAHKLAVSRNFLRTEDVDHIRSIVENLQIGSTVVDLGAGSGTTALSVFAQSRSLTVFTFDISPENVEWARKAIAIENLELFWNGEQCDSSEAAQKFDDNSVDFLMIDTSHEEEHTYRELVAWWPKIKIGGYLWMHDYVGEYPGVKIAIEKFFQDFQNGESKILGLSWSCQKI